MAILSNINDKFAVESTGAIQFNGSNGAAGYILKSNGNTSPTWVDPNTVGTGPWLPIAGGAITGNLTIGGTLGVTGNATFGGEINLADNKAILFGGGGKAFIKHDGSNFLFLNDTGNITFTNRADDGDFIFVSDNGSGGTAEYYKIDGGSVLNIFYKDVFQPDNVKSLYGSSSDLQIYHDASNSYISDTGTGRLIIKTNYLEIDNAAGNEAMIEGIENGAVNLFYDGVKKFETTSTGVDVTGNITFGDSHFIGDDASDNLLIQSSTGENIIIDSLDDILFRNSGVTQLQIKSTRSIFAGKVMLGSGTPVRKLELRNITGARNFGIGLNDKDGAQQATIAVDGNTNDLITASTTNMRFFSGSVIGNSATLPTNQALVLDTSQSATFAGNITVSGTSSLFNTGNSGSLITNDSDGYVRVTMTSASAQLGLFRKSDDGMYIGGSSAGFRVYNSSFSEKLLIDSGTGDATFAGNILVSSTSNGIFLGGTGSSSVLKKFVGNQAGNGAQWTPSVTSTGGGGFPTYTSSGFYQQIGNVVTASFEFTISDLGSASGTVIITNLPIAISQTNTVAGYGHIKALGQSLTIYHHTATNQIGMNKYDGSFAGTTNKTIGTVTYWAAT